MTEQPHDLTGVDDALRRMNLLREGDTAHYTPLTGGVASDIWRVETSASTFAVKRALPKLRVAADWRAPVERNIYEVKWMRAAGAVAPSAVPATLGHDPQSGLFAMSYLEPAHYPIWKNLLRDGHADAAFAAEVGRCIGAIHAATARNDKIAADFPTDATFHAIRLEPYLEATARKHAEIADTLMALSRDTLAQKLALVHGDVSPKNILAGPDGPVFLDAECAWYGDPAFDLAFCLNHMLLKCLWTPSAAAGFLSCFDALAGTYLRGVTWEAADETERRTSQLLPGLFLARVDGKSPVEYITDEKSRDRVRKVAIPLIANPVSRLADIRSAWAAEIGVS